MCALRHVLLAVDQFSVDVDQSHSNQDILCSVAVFYMGPFMCVSITHMVAFFHSGPLESLFYVTIDIFNVEHNRNSAAI